MVAFSISLLFCLTSVMALAVLRQSFHAGLLAWRETQASFVACGGHREIFLKEKELRIRLALPMARARLVLPEIAIRRTAIMARMPLPLPLALASPLRAAA